MSYLVFMNEVDSWFSIRDGSRSCLSSFGVLLDFGVPREFS